MYKTVKEYANYVSRSSQIVLNPLNFKYDGWYSRKSLLVAFVYLHLREHGLPYSLHKIARWLGYRNNVSNIASVARSILVSNRPLRGGGVESATPILLWLGFDKETIEKTIALYNDVKDKWNGGWQTAKLVACLYVVSRMRQADLSKIFDVSEPTIRAYIRKNPALMEKVAVYEEDVYS